MFAAAQRQRFLFNDQSGFSSLSYLTISSTGDCSCLRSWGRIRSIQKFPRIGNIKKSPYTYILKLLMYMYKHTHTNDSNSY